MKNLREVTDNEMYLETQIRKDINSELSPYMVDQIETIKSMTANFEMGLITASELITQLDDGVSIYKQDRKTIEDKYYK